MTVHAAVASALTDLGTETIFGVLGDANMLYLADFMRDKHGRFVGATHEGAAVSMADGYSRVSGRTGVASVTHGPALTNTLTALVEAVRNRSRLLLITGETPAVQGYMQDIDIRGVVSPTGAGYERVYRVSDAVSAVCRAFRRIAAERRPIVLDVPFDLLARPVPQDTSVRAVLTETACAPDAAALDRALGLLAAARRPVIVAGRGAVQAGAREPIIAVARATGAYLATTLLAKDYFRGVEGNLGICGSLSTSVASREIAAADCVLAIGAGLNSFTAAALPQQAKVIHCDNDPGAFGVRTPVDVAVLADARAAAVAMAVALDEAGVHRARTSLAQLEADIAADPPGADFADASDDNTVDVRSAMIRLDEMLPPERMVVTDIGRYMIAPWRYLHVDRPAHFVHSCNFGSIGLGLGTAIGASVADGDVPVIAVLGDGGFMMNMAEFSTAVRNKLGLMVIVANDGAYGAEYRKLAEYGVDPAYALNDWPDFTAVAEAMGARGVAVRSVKELDAVAELVPALADGPVLVDLKLNPSVEIGLP
jgi:acetolactate synthase-1/2/3 large subunit